MSKRSHHRPANTVNINELAEALNKAGYSQTNNNMAGFPPGMGGPQNGSNPLGGLFGGGGNHSPNHITNSLGALTSILGGQGGQMPNMGAMAGMGGMGGMGGMPNMGMPQMPMNQGMPQMPQTPPANAFANGAPPSCAPPAAPRPQQTTQAAAPPIQGTQPVPATDMEMIKDLFKEILEILKEKE